MKDKLFFGHPINTAHGIFTSKLEQEIQDKFPGVEIVNPNTPDMQRQAHAYGVNYFIDWVLPHMDGGVFLPFADGKWGYKSFEEAQTLQSLAKPVYQTDYSGNTKPFKFDESNVLCINDTMKRLYGDWFWK